MSNFNMIPINPDYQNVATTGSNLIEASAGTGKTFSILRIYLRFLLKHFAKGAPLSVDQLLLVTFTNAAAQEMRERLLGMLTDVYNYCAGIEHEADTTLTNIVKNSIETNPALTEKDIAEYLNELMGDFDKAPVFTIHSFCGRVQQEWFPKAGLNIEQRMRIDSSDLLEQVVKDYWRREVSNPEQSDLLADWFTEKFSAPVNVHSNTFGSSLTRSVKGIESPFKVQFVPKPVSVFEFADELEKIQTQYFKLKEAIDRLTNPEDEVRSLQKRVKIHGRSIPKRTREILEYVADQNLWLKGLECTANLSVDTLAEAAQEKNIEIDEFPDWVYICTDLSKMLSDFYEQSDAVFAGILADIHSLVRERCEREALITHDLQLKYTLQGLISSDELSPMLAHHYKCIMVDEFQDTDSTQFEIFDRIYNAGDHENAIYYIGDPKQSIYSFRNADIDTYLKAKHQVDTIYTLKTNYRSSEQQIQSMNELFDQPNKNTFEPFAEQGIPFNKVEAHHSKIFLKSKIDEIPEKGLRLIQPGTEEGLDKKNMLNSEEALVLIADEIVRYLKAGNYLTIREKNKKGDYVDRPVEPKDIAVIVSKHDDAEKLKQLLSDRGLGAVLYNRPSVFKSDEARWITNILKAVIDPQNIGQLKLALTSPLFDATNHDVIRWSSSDEVQDDLRHYQQLFAEWHTLWEKGDISSLFQTILNTGNRRERLLSADQGDRKITNVQHIVDILASYERERNTTPVGVVQFLKLKRQQADRQETDEDDEIKLETDEDLIKIMTVFRSKGLEFNIVFTALSFIMTHQKISDFITLSNKERSDSLTDTIVVGEKRTIPGSKLTVKQAQELDNAKEAIRKFYVALTRAVYQTVVIEYTSRDKEYPCVPAYLMKDKPVGKELDQLQVNKDDVGEFFEERKHRFKHISVETKSKPIKNSSIDQIADKGESELEKQRRSELFKAHQQNFEPKVLRTEWNIGSYSAITRLSEQSTDISTTSSNTEKKSGAANKSEKKTIYDLSRGAQTGNMLHAIFEYIDFHRWQEYDHVQSIIQDQCQFYGYEYEEWKEVLTRLVDTTFNKQLVFGDQTIRFRDLNPDNLKKEMEFYIDHQSYQLGDLLGLFRDGNQTQYQQLKGYLMGFIDLTFIHNEKIYLLDYKSNYLGDLPADYSPDIIKENLLHKDYDIQYHIYAYAAHRILGAMIPDYDFDKHFGGVCYLYFRGLEGEGQSGVFTTTTEPDKDTILKMDSILGHYHD